MADDNDKLKKEMEDMLTFPGEAAPGVTKISSVSPPIVNPGDKLTGGEFKLNTAEQIGATSDAVLTGSPAQEYGSTGAVCSGWNGQSISTDCEREVPGHPWWRRG